MTNFERITASIDDLAWQIMEFRIDAYCSATGYVADLPNTKKDIAEWLRQESEVVISKNETTTNATVTE